MHIRRLAESRSQLRKWREKPEGQPRDASFRNWDERTVQSMKALFGDGSDYATRFIRLNFCAPFMMAGFGQVRPAWTPEDEWHYRRDLDAGESLLVDAMEEMNYAPPPPPEPEARRPSGPSHPPVVVQLFNNISQTVTVNVETYWSQMNLLPLDPHEKAEAQKILTKIEEGAPEHDWGKLGAALETAKGIGKGLYEHVALPMFLELMKKQMGL